MNNSFDHLVEILASDYGVQGFPEKRYEHEIYCFEFGGGISIKIYQDEFCWVYFLVDIGRLVEAHADALMGMLHINGFSFRRPFFTLGLNGEKTVELHACIPSLEVDSAHRLREVFEGLLGMASEIKEAFNFE